MPLPQELVNTGFDAREREERPRSRALWKRPVLERHGDLRQLTMGTSTGAFESSSAGPFFTP